MFGHGRSRFPRKLHLVETASTNNAPPEATKTANKSGEIAYFIGGNMMTMLDDEFWDHGPEKAEVAETIDPDIPALG